MTDLHLFRPEFYFAFHDIQYLDLCLKGKGNDKFVVVRQMTETLQRTSASHRKLEEEMRDSNEKKDAVAQWEGQIAEIIQWYVLCYMPSFQSSLQHLYLFFMSSFGLSLHQRMFSSAQLIVRLFSSRLTLSEVFRLVMLISRFHALWHALLLFNSSRNAIVKHVTRKIA